MDPKQENGDWLAVWEAYAPKLLLFARQQTSGLNDAEDLVQEAFVRYWKARQKNHELPPTLLFTMIKRIAIDNARKWKARCLREAESQSLDFSEAFFAPVFEEQERRELIEKSIRALPVDQREVLVLKLWSGLTFEEIGRSLEISPNTAASRYRYALNQLRELLVPVVS